MVHPGIHFKAIEGDTLPANAELGQFRAYIPVKAVAVHAQIGWGITESDQSGLDTHRSLAIPGFKAPFVAVLV